MGVPAEARRHLDLWEVELGTERGPHVRVTSDLDWGAISSTPGAALHNLKDPRALTTSR